MMADETGTGVSESWDTGLGDDIADAFSESDASSQGDGDPGAPGATPAAAAAEATPAAPVAAATTEQTPAADAAITREDGAVWNVTAKRWQKSGAFVEGEAPAAAATAPATPATPAPEPFRFRHHGAEHVAEGWEQHADGSVRVPPDKVGQLRQALSSAREYSERVPVEREQLQRQVAETQQRSQARVNGYAELSGYLLDIVEEILPQQELGTDRLKLVQDRARMMLERAGALGSGAPTGRPPTPAAATGNAPANAAPRADVVRSEALAHLTDAFHTVFLGPAAAAIPVGPDREALLAAYSARLPAYIVTHEGQSYFNEPVFQADLARDVKSARDLADLRAQLAASKLNAAPARPVPPRPAPRAPAPPAPAPGAKPARFNLDDFQRSVGAALRE